MRGTKMVVGTYSARLKDYRCYHDARIIGARAGEREEESNLVNTIIESFFIAS